MNEFDRRTAKTLIDLGMTEAQISTPEGKRGPSGEKRAEVTVHQLRVFWAVARSTTMTQAAKQLGLAQPSLSQQLSKLEATIGSKLFHRRSGELSLTQAGTFLLPRAEHVLRGMRELEDGLDQFSDGKRVTVRIAGINSVLRVILPAAIEKMRVDFPDADFDIQESAPTETLEMLYGRRINIGLLAANSVAQDGVGFVQVPVVEDPSVLVVPEQLHLDGVHDPERDLEPFRFAQLNQTVKFVFGTQHDQRVEDWYDEMLPGHRMVAQCRSFEVALALVRAGAGICIAPALSAVTGRGQTAGVRLYRIGAPARRIVALVPSQYRRMEPYSTLLDTLQSIGEATALPPISPTPPFLDRLSLSNF